MLRELHIAGLGVIDDLDLELHEGLNVLTGETGAGKTMVAVGLSLALGARAASTLVREGAPAARIQARFDGVTGAEEWAEDGEILLARSIGSDGKSSARISGQLATVSALAQTGGLLVEVHGQHQAQRLLAPETQMAFLDRFAGDAHVVALDAYRELWNRWKTVRTELEALLRDVREREREADLLAFQVREIEAVGPRPNETEVLTIEEARLGHVERLLELAGTAESALGGDGSISDAFGGVAGVLDDAAQLDPTARPLAERGNALSAETAELTRDIRAYRESLQSDPERLQVLRERIQALRGLQRKYGANDAEVVAFCEETARRLASLGGADHRAEELAAEDETLRSRLSEQAGTIGTERSRAAPELAATIQDELHQLGMPGAAVEVAVEPLGDPGPTGAERVEFRLAAESGRRGLPFAKAASGGELSRTMLACRSVLADVDDVPTLVFDEVDAGIGGEAGLAVGRRLARLARDRQVLVVTHLPQIASFADRHIRIEKLEGTATIQTLQGDARVEELSRMLAGLTGSEGAVTHAEELLAAAADARTSVAG